MKEHREMLQKLKRNDRVITGGGIIGTIAKVRDDSDEIEVEIASGVRITVLRGTISSVVAPPAAANDAKPADAAKG
jgi:preprotein translocase subunit YajC